MRAYSSLNLLDTEHGAVLRHRGRGRMISRSGSIGPEQTGARRHGGAMDTMGRAHGVSRRSVLRWAMAGTAGLLASGAGVLGCRSEPTALVPRGGDGSAGPTSGSEATTTGPVLGEPEVLTSHDGQLDAELTAAVGSVPLAGRSAHTAAYNGAIPGPTLRLRPGDRVRLDLANELNEPTNLHFHGLHVPPDGTADNVFVSLPPGARRRYDFVIPEDHPGGTFWYHPHRHGLVAHQVHAGLYGAIVIDGTVDDLAAVSQARPRLLVLSDITLDDRGRVPGPTPPQRMMGREGALVMVNGQLRPRLTASAGGLERWRVLNASVSRFYRLQVQGHRLVVIGSGAAALAAPERREDVLLAPGQRVELLVRVGDAGSYDIVSVPYDRGAAMPMGMGPRGGDSGDARGPDGGMGPGGVGRSGVSGSGGRSPRGDGADATGTGQTVVFATLQSGDSSTSTRSLSIPGSLVPVADLSGDTVARTRQVEFGMRMGAGGPRFLIDGQTFDAKRVDNAVRLDTTEDWVIHNATPMDHPFHLHTWPFQVLDGPDATPGRRRWQDVVNVPANDSVRVRIRFRDFDGRSVYHCHILDHEDLGMMAVVAAKQNAAS